MLDNFHCRRSFLYKRRKPNQNTEENHGRMKLSTNSVFEDNIEVSLNCLVTQIFLLLFSNLTKVK